MSFKLELVIGAFEIVEFSQVTNYRYSKGASVVTHAVAPAFLEGRGIAKGQKTVSFTGLVSASRWVGASGSVKQKILYANRTFEDPVKALESRLNDIFDKQMMVAVQVDGVLEHDNMYITALDVDTSSEYENTLVFNISLTEQRLISELMNTGEFKADRTEDPYTYYDYGE